jgi:ABC-type nitrate/sulfonate/bicarbonate transport system ATPase subunit
VVLRVSTAPGLSARGTGQSLQPPASDAGAVADHRHGRASSISIRGLSKTFRRSRGAPILVLQEVDFYAREGEFVSVIGPSGCGKSTLFSLIAGLDTPDAGTLEVDGSPIDANRHSVAYMPQKDLLFPWRSVLRNVTLPLEIQGVARAEAQRRAKELLPLFGLEGFETAYPFTLSGGMRQRAALLRTVIQDRPLMLLDEPFGALDSLTRTEMQDFLLSVWSQFRRTVIFITHDIRESIYLSDRIYVMTARPARIRMVVDVPLARPRMLEVIATSEFAALEATLSLTLREENLKEHEAERMVPDVDERGYP